MPVEIKEMAAIPKVIWVAFVCAIAWLALDALLFVTIAFSASSKVDPGVATLCGAVIGLSVVAWQARAGFQNLIKSQENQSHLDREARLHQAELQQTAEERAETKKKAILLGALRAEIVYLLGAAHEAENNTYTLILMQRALKAGNTPAVTKTIVFPSFTAPVFQANIHDLGVLGPNLGADIVKSCLEQTGRSSR